MDCSPAPRASKSLLQPLAIYTRSGRRVRRTFFANEELPVCVVPLARCDDSQVEPVSCRKAGQNATASGKNIKSRAFSTDREARLDFSGPPLRNGAKIGVQTRVITKGRSSTFSCGLEQALNSLHVRAVPADLPCRETQFAEVYEFVKDRLMDGIGGCMYISGVPGTGKTATIRGVMTALHQELEDGVLPDFTYVEINGMKLTEPHQAYVQILKQLTGKKSTAEQAGDQLNELFNSKTMKKSIVLLADELDLLWTRKQQVLYNLFNWPSHPSSKLVVVAIANTMDLPERMMANKVASRMGLSRMTFQPYTFQELQKIVSSRLNSVNCKIVDPDAIELIARKVAALSGDARRALDLCRRAVELSRESTNSSVAADVGQLPVPSPRKGGARCLVSMSHVNRAILEMFSSLKIVAIQSLSLHEQLLLRAIVAEFIQRGVEESVFYRVLSQYEDLARQDGVAPLNGSLLSTLLSRLASMRLVVVSDAKHDFQQKIYLNVASSDVSFALQKANSKSQSK